MRGSKGEVIEEGDDAIHVEKAKKKDQNTFCWLLQQRPKTFLLMLHVGRSWYYDIFLAIKATSQAWGCLHNYIGFCKFYLLCNKVSISLVGFSFILVKTKSGKLKPKLTCIVTLENVRLGQFACHVEISHFLDTHVPYIARS